MVVLCTTSALAETEQTQLYTFRCYFLDGERHRFTGTTPYTFTGDETTFEFSAGVALTQDGEGIMSFQPYTIYEGDIRLTTTSSIPDVFTLSSKFFLLKKTSTDGADYTSYTPLVGVVLKKTITQTYDQNSATNRTNYYLHYAFQLDDSIDAGEYYYLAIRCPITPNLYEPGDNFFIDSITVRNANYSAQFEEYVSDLLDAIIHDMAANTESIEDAVGSVVTALNNNQIDIMTALSQLQTIQNNLLAQGQSIESAIDLMGININQDFIHFYQDLTNWTVEHDAAMAQNEDSITQQRANAGQTEAADVFNSTKFTTGLTSLVNGINYTGTSFNFRFPAAHDVPYLGDLWDSKTIPFKEWIDKMPTQVLIAARAVFWLGVVLSVFWHFQNLLDIIGGVDKE